MLKRPAIVINTSPLVALVAAVGNLDVLQDLYDRVLVPFEVCREILVNNASRFAASEFAVANWLEKQSAPLTISPILMNALDVTGGTPSHNQLIDRSPLNWL